MLKIPALPKCQVYGGDHSLIRIVKMKRSFIWDCLLCGHRYTVYRDVDKNLMDMIYERTKPDEMGNYLEMRIAP